MRQNGLSQFKADAVEKFGRVSLHPGARARTEGRHHQAVCIRSASAREVAHIARK